MTRLWIAMMMALLMWPLSLAASASMAAQRATVSDTAPAAFVICTEMGTMSAGDTQVPPVSVRDCTHCAVCASPNGLKADMALAIAVLVEVLTGAVQLSPPVLVETELPKPASGLSQSRTSRAPPFFS